MHSWRKKKFSKYNFHVVFIKHPLHTTVRNAAVWSNCTEQFSCTQAKNGNVFPVVCSGPDSSLLCFLFSCLDQVLPKYLCIAPLGSEYGFDRGYPVTTNSKITQIFRNNKQMTRTHEHTYSKKSLNMSCKICFRLQTNTSLMLELV